ncbi:MAG: N-acetyl-gamma-glutamyl-phosphate reductase [Desulfovibrionaceae bacterium]|nr:N-acetyl-gamma-glutamyl-phosphate reductase [Desulfovibrionaceae bacterium]
MSHTIIRAGLVGVTGYTGMELARLLAMHPAMKLTVATSRTEAGRRLDALYPFLKGLPGGDIILIEPDPDAIAAACDVAFLAVPHTAAAQTAYELLQRNIKVVDLSADFRLKKANTYETWYKAAHPHPELLEQAVYGLPELYAEHIAKARLVANPGCYPTSAILGLTAALSDGRIDSAGIIIDSASGTSGAGRGAKVSSLYCEVADSFKAYGVASHRHTPEIEQELSRLAGTDVLVSFTPHLVPMSRGIVSTIYANLNSSLSQDDIQRIYEETWAESPWIRVLPKGQLPETRNVRGTMFCDLAVVVDQRTHRLIIVSAIDNICRGASGQAIANANLMFGLPVETGLTLCAALP